MLKTLILQGPLFLCVAAAALMLMRLRWGLLTTLLLATWFGAAQLCGAATGLDHHVLRQFDDRIAVKEDEKILAHVDLSAEFRELLERSAHENLQVEFALRLHGVNEAIVHPAEIQVDEWTSDEPRFAVDATAFLEALKAHKGRMELAISPKAGSRGLLVHSWQNLGNPDGRDVGRSLVWKTGGTDCPGGRIDRAARMVPLVRDSRRARSERLPVPLGHRPLSGIAAGRLRPSRLLISLQSFVPWRRGSGYHAAGGSRMLIGYVSDERYVALADVLIEFEREGRRVNTRSTASGAVEADLVAGTYSVTLSTTGFGAKRVELNVPPAAPHQFRLLADDAVGLCLAQMGQIG